MKKKLLLIITLLSLSCSDDNSQLYCVTGINSFGNRVGLGCVYKDKIEEVKGRYPDIGDFQVYDVDNCNQCPQI